MAFFVKKLVVFLLPILLLTCSSHANDHLPHVREGDRKLLGLFGLLKGKFGNLKPKPTRWAPGKNSQKPLLQQQDSINPLEKWIKENTQVEDVSSEVPQKVTEASVKKIGESIAEKLFGANGKTGFRVGWTVGKWIYKLEKKCQEIEKALNVTCDQHSTLTDAIPGMSCVVLVAGVTGSVSCNEGILPPPPPATTVFTITPENLPCYYFNGSFVGVSVTQNPLKDCAINQVP